MSNKNNNDEFKNTLLRKKELEIMKELFAKFTDAELYDLDYKSENRGYLNMPFRRLYVNHKPTLSGYYPQLYIEYLEKYPSKAMENDLYKKNLITQAYLNTIQLVKQKPT